jgi:hypothetical protein
MSRDKKQFQDAGCKDTGSALRHTNQARYFGDTCKNGIKER